MIRATLLSTLCLVLSPLLLAQKAVPTPAPSHPAVTISKGTKIELIAMESVSSETAIKGSTVRFAVANDISVNGLIVVWAGTPITGKVTKVRRGTAYRQWAVLKIRVNAVTLTNGSTLRLTRSRPRNRHSIAPKDIATCAALFPLCILAAFGATEDGNEKPGAHSNEQSVLVGLQCLGVLDSKTYNHPSPIDGWEELRLGVECCMCAASNNCSGRLRRD